MSLCVSELEARLDGFASSIRSLSGTVEQPKTAFELLNTARDEGAWQDYLGYFLDPGAAHQLGGAFLTQFFALLESENAVSFSPPRTALTLPETIDVITERQSADDNRPDIIITNGEEWFLCVELKVHAPEGGGEQAQTVRYANDPGIVPGGTDAYEDGGFLYLKPASAPTATAAAFANLDWQTLQTAVDQTIAQSSGQISARTLAQLSDFSTLIESQLTMTDIDDATRKRKDLYFEYRDAITEAQNAIEPFVEKVLQQEWGTALSEGQFQPRNREEFDWQVAAVGNGHGQVRVPRWETAKSGSERLDIHWEHKPTTDYFKKGEVRFLLELEEPDRSTMSDSSGKRYQHFREDILDRLDPILQSISTPRWDEMDVSPGRSQKKLLRCVYRYEPGDEEGYYDNLRHGLEDTQPVTELVTELLESKDYTKYPLD